MDNANEIDADLTHKEVALFLGDELKKQNSEAAVTYDLVEEYAKTAKKKKLFVWILLALCFFIVGAGTFTTIGLVSKSNHKITINIDSFNDLNLRSLLSSAGRVQNLYESAVKNKEMLEQNLADELALAEQKRQMDLFTLQSVASVATRNSISDRKAKIELEYNTAVQKLHQSYDPQIADAAAEIKKYQSQVDSYDAAQLSQARSAESSIDSTKQLHDMEMRNQQDSYEQKIRDLRAQLLAQQVRAAEEQRNAVEEVRSIYQAKIDLLDPKAREQSNEQDKIILDAGIKSSVPVSSLWNSVESLDFNENEYTDASTSPQFADSVRKAKEELSELRTIAYRFKSIPMENSIKDYVPAMLHQSYQIAGLLAANGAKVQSLLNDFESYAETILADRTADGIILNTSGSPDFIVYVAVPSRFKVNDEPVPAQILSNGRHVADGTIVKNGGDFILTQTADDTKKQPYIPVVGDKIKILVQQ